VTAIRQEAPSTLCVVSPCLPSSFYDPGRIANKRHEVLNHFEENNLGHGPESCTTTLTPCTNMPLVIDLDRYLDAVKYELFNKIKYL
jgi:hypothetical protein